MRSRGSSRLHPSPPDGDERAFFEQLASGAGFVLHWQHLDADRNIAASAAIMHGEPAQMRKMLDELIREA